MLIVLCCEEFNRLSNTNKTIMIICFVCVHILNRDQKDHVGCPGQLVFLVIRAFQALTALLASLVTKVKR